LSLNGSCSVHLLKCDIT